MRISEKFEVEFWGEMLLPFLPAFLLTKKEIMTMDILHITPSSNGYEQVKLLANRINRTNGLALIERNGEKFMTGGLLVEDTPEIRAVLDALPKDKQYKFILMFRQEPYAKLYWEE